MATLSINLPESTLKQLQTQANLMGITIQDLLLIGVQNILIASQNQQVIHNQDSVAIEDDFLVGLFSGSSDLSEQCEDILRQEITTESGWTLKKSQR